MIITNKTVCRVITLIISSMLLISIITTGLTSFLTGILIGALGMSLFHDDLASQEYAERRRANDNNVHS